MSKGRGQISRSRLNAEFPHQVILPCSKTTGEANNKRHLAFIAQVGGSRQGHNVVRGDEWHHVFCFREAKHAEAFRAEFGGEDFDPKLMEGRNWALLREQPKPESALERWQRISAKTRRL
jgi:hypothetical protein